MKKNIVKHNLLISKYRFKWLLLVGCITPLIGCQTVQTPENNHVIGAINELDKPTILTSAAYRQQVAAAKGVYQQQFANPQGINVDSEARSVLLKAIKQHLSTDHMAVTETRLHDKPFIQEGSVDTLADSVYVTLIKMGQEYADKKSANDGDDSVYDDYDDYYDDSDVFYGKAYRTEDDYLEEPEAPYVNYIDEEAIEDVDGVNNESITPKMLIPAMAIDRQTAMLGDYDYDTATLLEYTDDIDTCVNELSYELDQIIADDSSIHTDTALVQTLLTDYTDCKAAVDVDYAQEVKQTIGYQQAYLTRANQCVSRYDTQITDLLNPVRQPKDIDYDQYDSIFESYDDCNDSLYTLHDLEPVTYIDEGWPQYILDYKKKSLQCTDSMIAKQGSMVSQGITYTNSPDVYADVYEDNIVCLAEAESEKEDDAAQNKALYSVEDDDADAVADTQDDDTDAKSQSDATKETMDMLLGFLKLSPQQLEANNFYRNQYQTLTRISEFNAANKQINDIYSYNFASPSALYTVQLPIALDFNQAKMTIDPSAFLPILAIATPENAPTLEEMTATTVAFNLPEEIAEQLPAHVVYDAFIDAIGYSLSELDSTYFTLMSIDDDAYAQEVGASLAIKVHLDSHQTGKLLGVMVKRMADTLQNHITDHPEDFSNIDTAHLMLKKWQELDNKYQTDDVGALFQMVEAVAPISLNKVNYYYLDSKNHLLAKQTRRAIGSGLVGATSTILSQTRFDNQSFNAHPLHPLFVESYGVPFTQNEPSHLAGNVWLAQINKHNKQLKAAQMARDGYYDNDDDYQPDIRMIDYGNVNDLDINNDSDINSDDSTRDNDIENIDFGDADSIEEESDVLEEQSY